ncbi:hypothetical protein HOLleu_10605 [Holothuria leucospilota]|uniref:Reverse transcriptase domain-containing protein n=1 Tax=Holothuria leucospilota TaxID=206669 RepID=A0A9Q1HBT9_HOLLE|nr:hypothetical protein HOLleu_10605 [Holothuria leucospilota]
MGLLFVLHRLNFANLLFTSQASFIMFLNKIYNSTDVRCDRLGRCISVLCTVENFSFRICNVHAPNAAKERKEFLSELDLYIHGNHPVVLVGDFNCVLDRFDRLNAPPTCSNSIGRKELQGVISTYSLIDCYRLLHPNTPGYTWTRTNHSQSTRLDRIYLPKDFDVISADTSPFPFSDHNPVWVHFELPSPSPKGRGYWKYNVSLSKDECFCKDLINYYALWKSLKPGFQSVSDWWECIKIRIRELAIQHGKRIAKEKRERVQELLHVCSSSSPEVVEQLINNEVEGAYVRSRAKYLDEGEKMSAFFFRQEKRRADQKVIHGVKNAAGATVSTSKEILGVFESFYSHLYSKERGIDCHIQDKFINSLNKAVSENDKERLDAPITLGEIRNALALTAANKAPGCDGIPYEFYMKFFDLISNDFLEVINDIFERGRLTESQSIGVITLLRKKGDELDPGNWRPISLLNTDYKLISKVLQLRLSKVMPSIVNEYQTCAIPGRTIHNNMFLIRDMIDFSSVKNSSCAFLSIDQEKAFDKVDLAFLTKTLRKFNFGENFLHWIAILYNNIQSRVLVNGFLSNSVPISRGVRQGCPLSPLLYVLFIEPLARYIHLQSTIQGFILPGEHGKRVKFLQYADDATCVASSITDISQFLAIFDLFQKATGASINVGKTKGLKLGRMKNEKVPGDICFSCSSIKITGILFGTPDVIQSNWTNKLNRAIKILNGWKNRHLSLIGKVLVVNTVIYPLFYYIAPVYRMPDSVIKDLSKAVFSFIWGEGKPDLVSRRVISLPKESGGLVLDNLRTKVDALFVKPLFSLLDGNYPTCLSLARYFLAKSLRFPFSCIWSNSRPNSGLCSPSLLFASDILKRLFSLSETFHLDCKKTKDIVKLLLQNVNVDVTIVKKHPTFPWDKIWKLTFSEILDNKLKDFQWRLAHGILYTGQRIRNWGMGDGLCPRATCTEIETAKHILWDCPKNYKLFRGVYYHGSNDYTFWSFEVIAIGSSYRVNDPL